MLRLFTCLALLGWPVVAWAEVFTIAAFGDTQRAVYCRNGGQGWNYAVDAFDAVAASSDIDLVLQTGDIVETFALRGDGDCFCWGTANPGSCLDIDHPLYGTGTCNFCGSAAAIACTGGITGLYCEWERARALADKIEAGGIPWLFVDGNHDYDTPPSSNPVFPQKPWEVYEAYFGRRRMTSYAQEIDTFVASNGGVRIGHAASMVVEAAGIRWLVISFPMAPWWRPTAPGAAKDKREVLAWAGREIEEHLGMPTILLAHEMITFDGTGPSTKTCGFCEDDEAVGVWWMGHDLWNELAERYRQVFLMIGGHDRGVRHIAQETDAGDKVIGVLVDYSFGLADAYVPDASWISDDNNPSATTDGNGGGGVILRLHIDPVRGVLWTTAYSPREDERDWRDGEYGWHWSENIGLCEDGARFDIPVEACVPLPGPPRCCAN